MGQYADLLLESYQTVKHWDNCLETKLEYVGDYIFDFTTYDGEMSALFASKALEVCEAITNTKTFDYIGDEEGYKWFLLMCNMPFFADRIEWGTSIRGCWWDSSDGVTLETVGIFKDGEQLAEMQFTAGTWVEFLNDLAVFATQQTKEK